MGIVGNLVQDLFAFLKVGDIASVADFPAEMQKLKHVLDDVEQYTATRQHLTAEMADSSHTIKTQVIRSEDARILADWERMREIYTELHSLNFELIGEYTKRANNHAKLMSSLKEVNEMIQKAARLRNGKYKTKVVSLCRKAIKKKNVRSLFHIIMNGDEPVVFLRKKH